ncbi:MAG: AAA family ATPase [Candidatus Heimdallarchaeota archaeon]|nr:AAA family ATPase [Candidatus Heimdallarchaeota archaeon]
MILSAVHSYKGGSGKSLFSLNVANILRNNHEKRILIIESDFTMPSFQQIFVELNPDIFLNDYLNQDENPLEKYIYNTSRGFDIIFVNEAYRSKDKVHGVEISWFLKKIGQIREGVNSLNYDHIIFDLSPGFHLFSISIFPIIDKIFLVMRPDYQSYQGLWRLIRVVYQKAVLSEKLDCHLIFNQIPNYDLIDPVIESWISDVLKQFTFFSSIEKIKYNDVTSYHTALRKTILPEDDPTSQMIAKLVKKIFLS